MARKMTPTTEPNPETEATKKAAIPYISTNFPPATMEALKARAEAEGIPLAALVRRSVAMYLAGEQPPVKAAAVDDILARIEQRLADLDRRVDSIAINAVRAADRVASIGKAD